MQDGVAGIRTRGFLRERRVTASAAGFQPRVAPREIRLSPGGCDGRCGGQAGRAAVHQRGRCAGQRRRPGLLPDLGVGFVGGHGRHPRPHWPLRLHLLPARLHLALPAFNSQGGKEVEQIF